MKTTYTRTMMYTNEELQQAEIVLYATKGLKWEDRNTEKVTYDGIKSWTIVDGVDAKELEFQLKGLLKEDEFHEYLILEMLNGEKEYFRNSHVVMFIR